MPFLPCASNDTGLNADPHIMGFFLVVSVPGPIQLRGLSTAVSGFRLSNRFGGFAETSALTSDTFDFSAALAADEMKLRSAARSE